MPDDVMFMWGELLTETTPAVNTGQILLDKTTSTLHVDTDTGRTQIVDNTKLPLSGGTMTGPINMNSQKITNLANPTANNDATNKIFVDTAFQTLEAEVNQQLLAYLQLKGGTMTGILDMGDYRITSLATPSSDTDAANKDYVDTQVSSITPGISQSTADARYVQQSGDTMSGTLSMGGNKITNLGTPSNTTDAATKQYVDNAVSGVTPTESYLPLSGGTMTGTLNMGSNRITSLSNPVNSNDAANKTYVDTQVSSITPGISQSTADGRYLRKTGGTLKGILNMSSYKITGLAPPTANTDAATKRYVDSQAGTKLPLSGGTMTGNLALGNHKITGLATPTANTDAANKQYVDSEVGSIVPGISQSAADARYVKKTGDTITGDITFRGSTYDSYIMLDSERGGLGFSTAALAITFGSPVYMSNNKITGLAEPTVGTDAATKGYVDDAISAAMPTSYLYLSNRDSSVNATVTIPRTDTGLPSSTITISPESVEAVPIISSDKSFSLNCSSDTEIANLTSALSNITRLSGATVAGGSFRLSDFSGSIVLEHVCLTGDTLIIMSDGSLKRLDEIKIGEYVLHFDFNTKTLVPCMVARIDAGKHRTSDTYELFEFEDNIVLKVVKGHMVYNQEIQHMKNIMTWEIGEHAYTVDGKFVKLINRKTVNETVLHYNMFVDSGPVYGTNYFANQLLVGDCTNLAGEGTKLDKLVVK